MKIRQAGEGQEPGAAQKWIGLFAFVWEKYKTLLGALPMNRLTLAFWWDGINLWGSLGANQKPSRVYIWLQIGSNC